MALRPLIKALPCDAGGRADTVPNPITGTTSMTSGNGKEEKMKHIAIIVILIISTSFLGCAGMTDTQQRSLSGAAMGAAAGTAVGAISGSAGWGAAIGAAAGATGGYLYDKNEKSKEAAYSRGYEEGKQGQ